MKFSFKHIALIAGIILLLFVIFLFIRGLQSSSMGLWGSRQASMAPMISRDYAQVGESTGGVMESKGMGYQSDDFSLPMPIPGGDAPASLSKIIRTAELTLLVDDIDVAAKMIERVRFENSGQPGNSSFGRYGSNRTGDITIWVPSDRFDVALSAIKSGALSVTNERVMVSDVSAQFVDIEARLKNMRATESQYLEIMKRSGSIPDILSVTRELSQARQSIEQLQGQLNYLSRQIALSSIHILITEEVSPMLSKDEWRPLSVIKSASRETLQDMTRFADMLLVFLIKLPLLLFQVLFWGIILYGIWRFGGFVYARMRGIRLPESGDKL